MANTYYVFQLSVPSSDLTAQNGIGVNLNNSPMAGGSWSATTVGTYGVMLTPSNAGFVFPSGTNKGSLNFSVPTSVTLIGGTVAASSALTVDVPLRQIGTNPPNPVTTLSAGDTHMTFAYTIPADARTYTAEEAMAFFAADIAANAA
ncbi:MAG: hypothetical protein JO197_14880 [Acidobacteria bacterium]|nr:hypothetical protein [Acidobacteriota bacterium]MBV9478831.1 hypothetical protein [Acidobacteriota bacterium]